MLCRACSKLTHAGNSNNTEFLLFVQYLWIVGDQSLKESFCNLFRPVGFNGSFSEVLENHLIGPYCTSNSILLRKADKVLYIKCTVGPGKLIPELTGYRLFSLPSLSALQP